LFSAGEFVRRVGAVRAAMAARGIDVLLVDECEALFWLSGFDLTENLWRALVLPREGEAVMVLRRLDEQAFRERSWVRKTYGFVDWEGPMPCLVRALDEKGLAGAAIGLDLNSYCMNARRYQELQRALPRARFVDFPATLRELPLVKSAEEIAYLRRAAAIGDEAMRLAIAAAKPGVSPREPVAIASAAFVRLGADSARIGRVSAGRGWGFLHADLDDAPMAPGTVLHMELCPKVHGYSARLMRPTVIGAASAEQREAARILIETQDRQIASMVPGAGAREVDRLGRAPILDAGLRESYDNITGYMLGFYANGTPRTSDFTRTLSPAADWSLAPGMVVHVYNSAQALAFSETVLVTERGPERLTRIERRLFEVR
jgi:Xaa-Pro dipeptidase